MAETSHELNSQDTCKHAVSASFPEDATEQDSTTPPADGSQFDLLPPDADPYFLGEFITEARENIENAEAALLLLETDPENTEAVNTVFRAFHTVKGISMWLGLTRLADFAHRAESLLSRARDHEIRCTGGYADLALRSVDMLKELINTVQDALDGQPMSKPTSYDELMKVLADPEAAGITCEPNKIEPPRLGDLLVATGTIERDQIEQVAENQGEDPIGIAVVKSNIATLSEVASALRTQQQIANPTPHAEHGSESSVRVRTARLDSLIDMVGELVIAHSMVAQDEEVLHGGNHELLRKVAHTSKIVRELQGLSMSMRMVPLKATFQKLTRLVRDLSHKSGKIVSLVTEGDDTEIDRNMVDVINDPLMHMVRNACDHGIEAPDVREQNGKPREGTIRLAAYHSGGSVVIELQDDGKGMDRTKLLEKAAAKGLIEAGRDLSEAEVLNLIFEPGFSTAEQVTDVSGRGVGMDVVRKNVEAIHGRIDIASQTGHGSTFTLRLPLTLAITDGMLVRVGDERYILPTVNIHLSFRPDAGALSTIAGCGEMVRLREEIMPVFRLHRLFNIQGAVVEPTQALLVVVDDGKRRCALLVDELLGKQQVVAKSLGEGLKAPGITGGAILGDGRVGLILDPSEIVALARQTPAQFEKLTISY